MYPKPACKWARKRAIAKKIGIRSALQCAIALFTFPVITHADSATAPQSEWLEITLNGASIGTELSHCDAQRCLIARAALSDWRIQIPAGIASVTLDDTEYVELSDLPGAHWRYNPATQSLALTIPDLAFTGTQHDFSIQTANSAATAAPGSFLNYSLSQSQVADAHESSAALEWGWFGRAGVFTTTALFSSSRGAERLDSTWRIDRPESLQTLNLGDSISDSGAWGRARRFAGLQWRSNFALRPNLITFPLPGASGSSAVPATVDIYIDQVLRARTEVPAGPFEFQNLPVTTGSGEVEMRVRDVYGREQRVSLDYFVSPQLLTPGLRAFEYSFGLQRRGFGNDTSYRDAIMVMTERRGLSERLTGEWHTEVTSEQLRTGVNAVLLGPGTGLYSFNLAGSASAKGDGWLASADYEWRSDRFYASAGLSLASNGFDAASATEERTARRRWHAAMGWSLPGGGGALALSYLGQQRFDGTRFAFASLGYQFDVGRFGHLQFSLGRTIQPVADTVLSMAYSLPFGAGDIASVDFSQQESAEQLRLNVQHNPPPLGGFGYRATLQPGANPRFDLGLRTYQQHAIYSIEASRFLRQLSYRADISGGLAWIGGGIYAGQPLRDSFAVVQVDDFPGVGIYAEHRLVAHTNAHGRALIPNLRAYDRNRLEIEQADLPLDARIETLEQNATPAARSGMLVKFPVRREHSVQFRIVLEDGIGIPASAAVAREDTRELVPLGNDGQAFLSDVVPGKITVLVRWRADECRIAVHIPAEIPPLLDLGVFQCSGVVR